MTAISRHDATPDRGDPAPRDFSGTSAITKPFTCRRGIETLKQEVAMRKLLLASMVAIASAFAIAPASAASVQLGIGVGPGYDDGYYNDYGGYYPHRYYRHVYNDDYDNGGYVVRYPHRHHCRTELVSHWRHHHRVVEEVRVCGNGYHGY